MLKGCPFFKRFRKALKRFTKIVKRMREFSKRIRKAFKRLCDPFKRTSNGYKQIFPLNGKAFVSVFAFQVTFILIMSLFKAGRQAHLQSGRQLVRASDLQTGGRGSSPSLTGSWSCFSVALSSTPWLRLSIA